MSIAGSIVCAKPTPKQSIWVLCGYSLFLVLIFISQPSGTPEITVQSEMGYGSTKAGANFSVVFKSLQCSITFDVMLSILNPFKDPGMLLLRKEGFSVENVTLSC